MSTTGAGEELQAGRVRVEVYADLGRVEQDFKQIRQEAARTGREIGGDFRASGEQVGVFSDTVKGTATTVAGLAAMVGSRMVGSLKGFLGLLGRSAAALIDFGALGALTAAKGLRTLAESTRDSSGELSALGKAAYVAAEGLETVARVALTVAGVITGVQVAVASLAAALTVASIKAANDFAPGWNRVRTLLQGTPGELHAIRREVSRLAGDLGSDGQVATAALYELFSNFPEAAKEPAKALEFLAAALRVNESGFGSAGEAIKATSGILQAFNLDLSEAGKVIDSIYAAQDAGSVVFGQVASEIGAVGAAVAALGGRYQDVLAILAVTTKLGISTSEVVTQLQSAVGALLAPSEDAKRAARELAPEFARLGIEFNAASLRAEGLVPFLLKIIEATGGNPEVLRRFFPDREGLSLLLELNGSSKELTEILGQINAAGGRTQEITDTMNDSWEAQSQILKEQLVDALRQVGFEFEGVGVEGLRAANAIIRRFREVERVLIAAARAGRGLDAISVFRGMGVLAGQRIEDRIRNGPPQPDPVRLPPAVVSSDRRRPEPATPEYARQKIEDLKNMLEASAVTALAASGDMAAYERAVEGATDRVNELVVSEMKRLEAAGVGQAALVELAGLYDADTAGYHKAEREREEAARKAEREREEDEKKLEAARERRQKAYEREVEQLREWAAIALRRKDAGLAAELEREARLLESLNRTWDELKPKLEVQQTVAPQFTNVLRDVRMAGTRYAATMQEIGRRASAGLIDAEEVKRQTDAAFDQVVYGGVLLAERLRATGQLGVENYAALFEGFAEEYERTVARIREAEAAGIIDPEAVREQMEEAARAYNERVLAMLAKLRDFGLLTETVYQEIVERLKAISPEDPKTQAREYFALARALGQAGEAMGAWDSQTRAQIDTVLTLIEELDKLRDAKGRLDFGKLTVAGAIAGVGAVAGLVGAYLQAQERERQERLRNTLEIAKNTRQLAAFRRQAIPDVSEAERSRILTLAEAFVARYAGAWANPGPGGANPVLRDLTADMLDFLTRLEEITGMEFFDQNTGRLMVEEFQRALEAFRSGDLGSFGSDLMGRLEALDFLFSNLGDAVGDAAERLRMFIETVGEFSPEFAAQLNKVLAEQGPEAARAWLEDLARRFASEGVAGVAGLFGPNATAEEIQRILERALSMTGEAGGLVAGGAAQDRINVSMTEVQANQLLRFEASQTAYLGEAVGYLALLPSIHLALVGRSPAEMLPAVTLPALGGSTTVVIQEGDTYNHVQVNAPTSNPRDREAWKQAGTDLADRLRADQEQRRAAAFRAAGLRGGYKIRTDQTP